MIEGITALLQAETGAKETGALTLLAGQGSVSRLVAAALEFEPRKAELQTSLLLQGLAPLAARPGFQQVRRSWLPLAAAWSPVSAHQL